MITIGNNKHIHKSNHPSESPHNFMLPMCDENKNQKNKKIF